VPNLRSGRLHAPFIFRVSAYTLFQRSMSSTTTPHAHSRGAFGDSGFSSPGRLGKIDTSAQARTQAGLGSSSGLLHLSRCSPSPDWCGMCTTVWPCYVVLRWCGSFLCRQEQNPRAPGFYGEWPRGVTIDRLSIKVGQVAYTSQKLDVRCLKHDLVPYIHILYSMQYSLLVEAAFRRRFFCSGVCLSLPSFIC